MSADIRCGSWPSSYETEQHVTGPRPRTEHVLQVSPNELKSFFWSLSQEEQFAVVRGARLQVSLDGEWLDASRVIPGPRTEVRIHPSDQHLMRSA